MNPNVDGACRAWVLVDGPAAALTVLMLAFASWSDLRTRRVANLQWLPWLVAVAALSLPRLRQPSAGADLAVAAGLVVLFWVLFRWRLFGGADAKALMIIALLAPSRILEGSLPIPVAASILMNATALVAVLPVGLFFFNLVRGDIRFPTMLVGMAMDLERARTWRVWPMQAVEEGRVRVRHWGSLGIPEDRWDELARAGLRRVWVTPKVPFMVPLLFGALAWVAWGNLLVRLLVVLAG